MGERASGQCICPLTLTTAQMGSLLAGYVPALNAKGACLVQEGHVFEQVVEAHDHGEDGYADEQRVGGLTQPGPVPQAPQRHVHRPGRQAALVQLQQPLIALRVTLS